MIKAGLTGKKECLIGLYTHYKGNQYEVVDLVTHSETEETMVLYRPCYGEQKLWVRPYSMFFEQVTLVDGSEVPRFNYVGEKPVL